MNARAAADARGPPLEEDGAGGNLRDQAAAIQAGAERLQEVIANFKARGLRILLQGEDTHADNAMSKKLLAVWVVVVLCLSVGFCRQQIQIRSLEIEAATRPRQVEIAMEDQNLVVLSVIFLLIAILAAAVKFKSR